MLYSTGMWDGFLRINFQSCIHFLSRRQLNNLTEDLIRAPKTEDLRTLWVHYSTVGERIQVTIYNSSAGRLAAPPEPDSLVRTQVAAPALVPDSG